MMRWLATAGVVLCLGAPAMAPAAAAVGPPQVPPGMPPAGPVAPPEPTEQRAACGVGAVLPGTQFRSRPKADSMMNYTGSWAFSRGAGQKVAVIDTGVTPNPRLPALQPGGDYVSSSDGLVDCDAHGTLVAGIIAATPSPDDAFAGVAPEATVLSIRQNSGSYARTGNSGAQQDPNALSPGYGDTRTLALAIVRAVDLGATVINLSEAACAPAGAGLDDAALGQAVRYAFERNVVVVAAAGNVDSQGLCRNQNDVVDPNRSRDDAWGTVRTVASPAWFADYVLTVASVDPAGEPSTFSLRGPWVDVAAPGEQLTSLSPNGLGPINGWQDAQKGVVPIAGTSFSAAYVSGVVALVRSRFPNLSAGQVMGLIERTAHTPTAGPNTATGYGLVDPVAALSYELPAGEQQARSTSTPVAAPPIADPASHRARTIVLAVLGVCCAAAAVALAVKPSVRSSVNAKRGTRE
jgi:membrane-anchored mycosin MYCP